MKHHSQSGSAHVLIIITLVVSLIGALGYIFWMNVTDKSGSVSKTANEAVTADTQEPVAKEISKACLQIDKMCFDYPKTWTASLDTDKNGYFPGDRATITSRNGFVISATSGIDGIGGTCDEDIAGTTVVVETIALAVGGYGIGDRAPYDSQQLSAAKIITVNEQRTSFSPSVMLTADKSLATKGIKEGCEVGYAALFPGKTPKTTESGESFVGLMTFGGSSGENKFSAPSSTEEDATNRLNSTDFNEAYEILTSVRYE